MNIRRISAIALSNRDFDSFDAKLDEACRWVSLAAGMGSDLAVLPEEMNCYCGDGPGNPRAMTLAEIALDDWRSSCASLLSCAAENKIAVTVPVMIREGGDLVNCFYLISAGGDELGRYVKTYPTTGELDDGVIPGELPQKPIDWDGIGVGGGICFDMNFRVLFERQKAEGADLFLCPSLSPGGDQMNYYARQLQRPFVLAYPAWSQIVDAMGQVVTAGGYRHETLRFGFGVPVYTADINFDRAVFHFDHNQEKIEAILRRYGRDVKIEFDQANSCFSVESLSQKLAVKDVTAAFELEDMDEYLSRVSARSHRPA